MAKQGIYGSRTLKMRKLRHINWKPLVVGLLVVVASWYCWNYISTKTLQAQTQKKLQAKEAELNERLNELNQSEQVKQELLQQKQELEKQLQAKKDSQKVYAAAPQKPVQAPQGVVGCGDNVYKQFIYKHESGCRTNAINSIGCVGLGQACPGSKLPCSLSDWACQDNWFSNYAIQRYGSWEKAYYFWVAHRWW